MVDTIKCQTEADLTELFFKKLLLGAIDKSLDHEETTASPSSSYNNYTHHPSQPTRTATANEDRQHQDEGNSTAETWDMDPRPAQGFHQVVQPHSTPRTATPNHSYSTPNPPHQPPRYFTEPNMRQTSEQQQPFPEHPLPRGRSRPLTMLPDDTNLPSRLPHHRRSLGFGLNKVWRGNQDQ